MKKAISLLVASVLTLSLLAVPARAKEAHIHTWSQEWSYDTSAHWHDCTAPGCPITNNQEKAGYQEHTGQWTVERTATERSSGLRYQNCPTCNRFIRDLTPASLPTADSYTLDLRKGPVTLTGDEKDALLSTLWDLPEVRLDDIYLQGPPEGYYVTLTSDREEYDLEIRFHYAPSRPDAPPNQVESVTCTVRPGSQGTFTAQVPEDKLSARLKLGQPIFGALTIRLGYEPGDFTDIEGHWAEGAIAEAVKEGWVNGYPDFTFRPQGDVTRAEMTKLFLAAVKLTPNSGSAMALRECVDGKTGAFRDMDGHWLTTQGWTDAALIAGLLFPEDYPNRKFCPNQAITRGEIAVLATRANGLVCAARQEGDSKIPFIDQASFSSDQAGYIREAAAAGIITGYPDGTFGADKAATRAEAVTMVARTLAVMHEGDNTALPEETRITLHLRSPSLPDNLDPVDLSEDCQIVDGLVYADLNTLAFHIRVLSPDTRAVSLTWIPENQSVSIQTESRIFVFTAGDTAYSVNGESHAFPSPVRMRNGNLMIPIYNLNNGTPCGPWEVSWEDTARTLTIPAVWPVENRE